MAIAVSNEPKRNNRKAAMAITICPINFCNDVKPKLRLKITFKPSSKNPITPNPTKTSSKTIVCVVNKSKIIAITTVETMIANKKIKPPIVGVPAFFI